MCSSVDFSVPQGSTYCPYLFIVPTNCIQYLAMRLGGGAIIYEDDMNIIGHGKLFDEVKAMFLDVCNCSVIECDLLFLVHTFDICAIL